MAGGILRQIDQIWPRAWLPKRVHYTAAAGWGGAFLMGGFWLIQPFDWMKATFYPPEEEPKK